MAKGIDIKVDTKILDAILATVKDNAGKVVVEIARDIRDAAKPKAPVFTGGLKESIYVSAKQGGDSFDRVSKNVRARWKSVAGTHSSYTKARVIELPSPENNETAYVGPSASYAVDVEFGSARRAGRAYFGPAVRQVEGKIAEKFMKAITDKKLR